MTTQYIFYVFGGTLLFFLFISLLFRSKRGTIQDYYWGGNSLSVGNVSSLILSNSFSMNGLLYQAWLGYIIGWWSLGVQLVWCLGYSLLLMRSERIAKEVSEGTIHHAIETHFGAKAGVVAAIASTIGFAGLIGWESVVGATFLKTLSTDGQGVSNSFYIILPLMLALVASFYTRNGGLKGNGSINLIQNALKIGALSAATIYLLVANPLGFGVLVSSNAAQVGLTEATIAIGGFVAFSVNLLFSFLWQSVDMSVWQNLAGVHSESDAAGAASKRRSLLIAASFVFLFPGLVGSLMGIALSGFYPLATAGVTDSNILNVFLTQVSQVPILAALAVASFAAAMLSTIDGYSLASAQAFTWDIAFRDKVRALLGRTGNVIPSYEDDQVVDLGRLIVFFVGIGGSALMIYLVFGQGVGLFTLVYAVVIGQMALAGPVLSILFGKDRSGIVRKGWLPIALALVGGLATLIDGVWFHPERMAFAPLVTIAISCAVTFLCIQWTASQDRKAVAE
jgi:Na+/proline symporter